jgi:hypothetical protein
MKPASGIQRLVSLAVILMMALPAPAFAATADYVYDSTGQLKWVKSGASTGRTYSYDEVGNRTDVDGGGGYPDIRADRISHDFGAVVVNATSAAGTFTFTNVGVANLTIGTVVINGADSARFGIDTDNCSSQTVTPGNDCTVSVDFSPTSGVSYSAKL